MNSLICDPNEPDDDEDDMLAAQQALAEDDPSIPAEQVWQELGIEEESS